MKIPSNPEAKKDRASLLKSYRFGVADLKPVAGRTSKGESPKYISRLQGSLQTSKVLLIAPIPTGVELADNLPWCNGAARHLFDLLSNGLGVEHFENSILIAPACFYGSKVKKGNHEPISELVRKAPSYGFTHFVAVGSSAFQTHFGMGKKPDMDVVAGTPLYPPITKGCPLFVFPDITVLAVDPDSLHGRDKHKTRRAQEEILQRLEQLLPMFRTFLSLSPAGRPKPV